MEACEEGLTNKKVMMAPIRRMNQEAAESVDQAKSQGWTAGPGSAGACAVESDSY